MKWVGVIVNLVAAVGFLLLGYLASGIHSIHSYSMYREFVAIGAVDEEKVKQLPIPENSPQTPPYDMPARMEQIGNAEAWFGRISGLAAFACVCNAGVILLVARRPRPAQPNQPVEDNRPSAEQLKHD